MRFDHFSLAKYFMSTFVRPVRAIQLYTILQNDTAAGVFPLLKCEEGSSGSRFEHIVDALPAQTRAFEISLGSDLSSDALAVVCSDESQRLFAHLLDGDRVIAQIFLQSNKDDGYTFAKASSFLDPLEWQRHISIKSFHHTRDGRHRTLCLTLSRESGVSTENPIRMTCALE